MDGQVSLSERQREVLFRPLNGQRVATRQGMSYLEEWDVEAHLTRIFGFEGWDKEISYELIFEEAVEWIDSKTKAQKSGWDVAYSARCRLVIKDPDGNEISHREDAGAGDALHQPSRSDAHHLALTSAVATALKRAAKSLGNQFGLSLYDKGSLRSVVGSSLAYPEMAQETPASVLPPEPAFSPDPEHTSYEVANGEQIPLVPEMEITRSGPPSTLATVKQANFAKRLLTDLIGTDEAEIAAWFAINCPPWTGAWNTISKSQASHIIDALKKPDEA